MPLDSVQISLTPQSELCVSYRICKRDIYSNQTINALSAFQVKHQQLPKLFSSIDNAIENSHARLLFKGSSWLAGKDRELVCSRTAQGFIIEVPLIAKFFVAVNQPYISRLDDYSDQRNSAVIEEVLLGPPLILALAINQQFALHASAVLIKNKAVLFVGESGFGKSTLAQWLDELTPLKRLADDISVLEHTDNKLRLLPDFLQMKLSARQQHANSAAVKLAAIVSLNRQENTPVKLHQLDNLSSIQALLNHSVATQLFDKPLAGQHLKFMSELSQILPIYTLDYPNGQQNLGAIAEILTKQIN